MKEKRNKEISTGPLIDIVDMSDRSTGILFVSLFY
jgi:hypothetical protein